MALAAIVVSAIGVCGASGHRAAPIGAPLLSEIRGSVVRSQEGILLVGLAKGGIAVYDAETRKPLLHLPGQTKGRTLDAVWHQAQAWWIVDGESKLYSASRWGVRPSTTDLGQASQPRRLGRWKNDVAVHSDADTLFVDATTRKVRTMEEVLPGAVATAARQGSLMCDWQRGRGILMAVRRYGRHSPGSTTPGRKDIALFSAWSVTGASQPTLRGHYTANVLSFTDSPGPNVRVEIGEKVIQQRRGIAPMGNVRLGPEGIIALDETSALIVPFKRDQWESERVELAAPPQHAESLAYSGSNVWWTSEERVYCASLEDGATDVYVPLFADDPVVGLAADEGGAWVLTSKRARRIDPGSEGEFGFAGYARYSLGELAARAETPEQTRLEAWLAGGSFDRRQGSTEFVREAFSQVGVSLPSHREMLAEKRRERVVRGELRYGDIIARANWAAIYTGAGRMLSCNKGALVWTQVALGPDVKVLRFIPTVAEESAFVRIPPGERAPIDIPSGQIPGAGRLPWRAEPVGIGRPNWSLGHGRFVRLNLGGRYDRPHLPKHQEMARIMETWIGTPYVWGGNTREGADCSGFVRGVFLELGINLPRHSQDMGQAAFGEVVLDELRYGDVLVFPSPKHVAIYVGGGNTVEAVRGGVGRSTIFRRDRAVVRRFILE